MADILKLRRGKQTDMPVAEDGELLVCTDTGKVFVGIDGENRCINPDPELLCTDTVIDDMFSGTSEDDDEETALNGISDDNGNGGTDESDDLNDYIDGLFADDGF